MVGEDVADRGVGGGDGGAAGAGVAGATCAVAVGRQEDALVGRQAGIVAQVENEALQRSLADILDGLVEGFYGLLVEGGDADIADIANRFRLDHFRADDFTRHADVEGFDAVAHDSDGKRLTHGAAHLLHGIIQRQADDRLAIDGGQEVAGLDAGARRRRAVHRRDDFHEAVLRSDLDAEAAELAARKAETEEELAEASAAPEEIAIKREELSEAIDTAEERRRIAADALADAEAALRTARDTERDAERLAGEAREARARAEARAEAARETVTYAAERIAEEAGATPAQLLDTLNVDPDKMPDAETLDVDVQRLKRQREAMGAVNLRAEEDAKAVNDEYDTLAREKGDLEEAIKKLRSGIAGLNKEGRERLLTAFEQVNANFGTLFAHLFGGGEARLVLVESDDPLEAGLEIMCQPPGKRLSTLSLLSGGEQTLTALALIFGVFLANPAPICVLDEVDAPLDDANVTRFCDLLDEMTRRTETRFLIITHHGVTMARMDRLFGVTMAEQGVSQLVSVDLKRAEALVA